METVRKIWGRVRPDRWRVVNSRTGKVYPSRHLSRWGAQNVASEYNEIAQHIGMEHTYEVRWI